VNRIPLSLLALCLLVATVPASAQVTMRTDPGFEYDGSRPGGYVDGGNCPPGMVVTDPLPFVHAGDTCGSPNTVGAYSGSCTLPFSYEGEDEVFLVPLGGGNLVSFEADLTGSAGDLALFLIGTCGDGTTCVINSQDAIGPGAGPEVINNFSGASGQYFLYVDSYYDAGTAGSCGTYTLTVSGLLPAQLLELSID
jgi:hypothetical protein